MSSKVLPKDEFKKGEQVRLLGRNKKPGRTIYTIRTIEGKGDRKRAYLYSVFKPVNIKRLIKKTPDQKGKNRTFASASANVVINFPKKTRSRLPSRPMGGQALTLEGLRSLRDKSKNFNAMHSSDIFGIGKTIPKDPVKSEVSKIEETKPPIIETVPNPPIPESTAITYRRPGRPTGETGAGVGESAGPSGLGGQVNVSLDTAERNVIRLEADINKIQDEIKRIDEMIKADNSELDNANTVLADVITKFKDTRKQPDESRKSYENKLQQIDIQRRNMKFRIQELKNNIEANRTKLEGLILRETDALALYNQAKQTYETLKGAPS